MIKGALIVVAALSIFHHTWAVRSDPRPLRCPLQGIGLNAVGLNAVAPERRRHGTEWRPVRDAAAGRAAVALAGAGRHGHHLLADVGTSCGVTLGLRWWC
jgi:hypothetical protein